MSEREPPTYDQALNALDILISRLSSLDDSVLPRLKKEFALKDDMVTDDVIKAVCAEADRLRDLCFEIMIEIGAARADAFGELGFPVDE